MADDVRTEHRRLSQLEMAQVHAVKADGQALLNTLADAGKDGRAGRELAIAKTKVEEAVMWAVKGLTG